MRTIYDSSRKIPKTTGTSPVRVITLRIPWAHFQHTLAWTTVLEHEIIFAVNSQCAGTMEADARGDCLHDVWIGNWIVYLALGTTLN